MRTTKSNLGLVRKYFCLAYHGLGPLSIADNNGPGAFPTFDQDRGI